jgi:hypothetical protein
MQTMRQRGWTTVKVSLRNYDKLDKRSLTKSEPFDDIIGRVLDTLEKYEQQYKPLEPVKK